MFNLERLPCPLLVTDCDGHILHTNKDFIALIASEAHESMDHYFPPASRIFLQTYAWPMLLKNGEFTEIYMQLLATDGQLIPVMTNARVSELEGKKIVIWLFFVAKERQRFEAELLKSRQHAEATAMQLAKVNAELEQANAQLSQFATKARADADQFAHLSLTDPLTALGNRRALSLSIEQWLNTASEDSLGSLLLIDIDYFKKINDTFGHSEGDLVLCELAKRLLESVRTHDSAIRFGGEEFVLWLPYTDQEGAKLTAKRVHENISEKLVADKKITVSIGISSFAAKEKEPEKFLEKLLKSADAALYEAKASGRNRTICGKNG